MTGRDPLDDLLAAGDPASAVPRDLAARIISAVPLLPQQEAEPIVRIGDLPLQDEVPMPAAALAGRRPRRWLVPLGLGGVMAMAASLAAIFLSSAQGWQGLALSPADDAPANAPVVAIDQPLPAPVGSSVPVTLPVPELAATAPRRDAGKPAIRPAAPPVLTQVAAPTAPAAAPAPVASLAAELAIHADDSPLPQLSPSEAAAIERRAERRAAREAAEAPPGSAAPATGMGLRAGPIVQTSTPPRR